MEYVKATEKDLEQIAILVRDTIQEIYPKYYPKEVVDFFCELHCRENIFEDIKSGFVGVLRDDDRIVGTGCYKENHITRVYVKPEDQGKGYGSYMMQCLENQIRLQYDTVYLDASLPASHLYEKRGYQTTKHEKWNVENGRILVRSEDFLFRKEIQKMVRWTEILYSHTIKRTIFYEQITLVETL